MSFRERGIEDEERECGKSVSRVNGSVTDTIATTTQFTIDENLLVDPKLLFIGSIIGEGAHGKVYQGRLVDVSSILWECLCIWNIVFIMITIFASLVGF